MKNSKLQRGRVEGFDEHAGWRRQFKIQNEKSKRGRGKGFDEHAGLRRQFKIHNEHVGERS
jgi:hypothetical protein